MATKIAPVNKKANEVVVKAKVAVESWRFQAYICFWGMCMFAIACHRILVVPKMLKGPADGRPCGPYDRSTGDEFFNLKAGEGYNVRQASHLEMLFGFENICVNWDYEPSRQLTAMVYPLFEYSLLVYLILDFAQTKLSYKRGELTEWFYAFSKVVFPINVFLCAMFRMIFVCIAYESPSNHTAGFLGLQISLVLVAIQNTLYVIDSNVSYDFLGGMTNTRLVAIAYLLGIFAIGSVKVSATIFVVQNGRGAPWTLEPAPIGDQVVGQLVDKVWMVFNAVLPLIISFVRSQNEYPLNISVTSEEPNYVK